MRIGVLSLQGDVIEYHTVLKRCHVTPVEVRTPHDLEDVDALIIPGGESTTIGKLMVRAGLDTAITEFSKMGKPIYGTCAGAILLAKNIVDSDQFRLGLMDITVRRNAYGRQLDSFTAPLAIPSLGMDNQRVFFIRAPLIESVGKHVKVLAEHNGNIVLAQQDNLLVSTFHPELSGDTRVHRHFLSMIGKR